MKPIFFLTHSVLSVPLLPDIPEQNYFAVEKYFDTVTNETS
jgi:hypothetical protein